MTEQENGSKLIRSPDEAGPSLGKVERRKKKKKKWKEVDLERSWELLRSQQDIQGARS